MSFSPKKSASAVSIQGPSSGGDSSTWKPKQTENSESFMATCWNCGYKGMTEAVM